MPRALVLAVTLLVVPLSGCTMWPFGGSGDDESPSPGDATGDGGSGEAPRSGNVTFQEAVTKATTRVRDQFGADARITRVNATVDAVGDLRADATFLFHVNGPMRYEDAWRTEYEDAGSWVTARVRPAPSASALVTPVVSALPALQGVLFDAGEPAPRALDAALRAARGAVPASDGAWRVTWEPLACPDAPRASAASWRVENATLAARVTPDGASLCAGPGTVDALVARLVVIADVPHGTFVVDAGGTVTAPVDVSVRAATGSGLRFILALSGAGPNGPGDGEGGDLPDGWSARTTPDAVNVGERGLERVNVTLTVPSDAAPGEYRFNTHPRSDAPRFSGGQDEPLRVFVRSTP